VYHEELIKLLPWYVNETLAPGERLEVERHLKYCGACNRRIAELRSLELAVLEEKDGLAKPAHDAVNRALGRIRSAPSEREGDTSDPTGGAKASGPDSPHPGFQGLLLCTAVAAATLFALLPKPEIKMTAVSIEHKEASSGTVLRGNERGNSIVQVFATNDKNFIYLIPVFNLGLESDQYDRLRFALFRGEVRLAETESPAAEEIGLRLSTDALKPGRYRIEGAARPEGNETFEPLGVFQFDLTIDERGE